MVGKNELRPNSMLPILKGDLRAPAPLPKAPRPPVTDDENRYGLEPADENPAIKKNMAISEMSRAIQLTTSGLA